MELHGIFLWNSMENVQILYGKCRWTNFHGNWFIHGEIYMEFHGNGCPNPPWNSMENFPWNSMEVFHTEITQKNAKTLETTFYSPSEEESEKED